MAATRIPDQVIKRLWSRYVGGATLKELADERNVTPEAISYLFKSRGLKKTALRRCALPECGKEFFPMTTRHRCCCRQHVKRLHAREAKGLKRSVVPCALPECEELVVQVHSGERPSFLRRSGEGRRFCSREHSNIAHARRKSGWYKRLLDQAEQCIAPGCNERVVLDEHHIVFTSRGSDKDSPVCTLCPTHHMAVHRGFAEIRDGEYVDLIPRLLAAIEKKSVLYEGYEQGLDPSRFKRRRKDGRRK